MRYFLAILAFSTAVCGAKILPKSEEVSSEKFQKREIPLGTEVVSQNARVFSQEDKSFPALYFYPTYPDYMESRHPGYSGQQLVPSQNHINTWSSAWTQLIPITSFALMYGAKAGIYIFSVMLILVVGVVFTTSICTFTPICTISFPAFSLTKNQIKKQIAELTHSYVTPESLNVATVIVQKAVDKFTNYETKENEDNMKPIPPASTIQKPTSTEPST